MVIRQYQNKDYAELARLFYDTVHTVNAHDYSAEQLSAWAANYDGLRSRQADLSRLKTLIAEINGVIAGFGSIDTSGYLDLLYVHKDYQRQGVATSLCDELERDYAVIKTHASITAKPFFEKRGYMLIKSQEVERSGVALTNFEMVKSNALNLVLVEHRTPQMIETLLNIWEGSVKATHSFLSLDEMEQIKSYVPQALEKVEHLVVAKNENDIVAFLGVENQRIEMLFVTPEKRAQGIGKSLVNFAAKAFAANEVTVNEQNAQAVGFYKKMGFKTYKRTEFDEQGNPYPLLYMHA